MAWRDSRRSRKRLLLYSTAIVLGIAALVAIGSFGHNLERGIDEHSKALLGADLVLSSRQPLDSAHEALFERLEGTQSREITFSSMVFFPENEGTRLVQVRALRGEFPFYGSFETTPPEAASAFRDGSGALVEEALLLQYGIKVGDPIRIGNWETRVAGSLQKVPGETILLATIAPRVFIAMSELPKTGLLREGSLARYRMLFQFGPERDVEQLVAANREQFEELRLGHETVEQRKENLGRSMDRLQHFLNLIGFIALLLGGVGVASAIHVHIKQKLSTVAVLRCLGCSAKQSLLIYLIQGMALGLAGALAGAALGILVQMVLPRVMADFVPFPIPHAISWMAVAQAIGIGFAICLLFALLPLAGVRRIPPLAALRASYGEPENARRDPLVWIIWFCLGAGIVGFALTQTQRWQHGIGFAAALAIAFAVLAGVALGLEWLMKRLVRGGLPYVWRQGLANLHRPQNRTVLLMVSLGLGTFLILTLYLTQRTILSELVGSRQVHQANAVLFDVQTDQREGVAELIRTHGLPLLDEAPIVTMRLHSIKGRAVEDILTDPEAAIPRWILRREYRSTYRSGLRDSEQITAGRWIGSAENDLERIPISVEEGLAGELNIEIGDELVFDVQGIPVETEVASLRKVDWRRVQPNFFVVFPEGAIEEAPAFHVFVTRVTSAAESAALQRDVVRAFPNVSAVDLTLVLETLDSVLGKIAFVVQFMALFTVATGLLVLGGAILTGRYQRIQESILLRTLGASRRQILQILGVEYFALGFLAALAGIVLSLGGTWALARFVFDMAFRPPLAPIALALLVVSLLTLAVGLLASRGVARHPPLEILRAEG
jgi:putative ABC transport system permease protein